MYSASSITFFDGLKEYKVIQKDISTFIVYVVCDKTINESVESKLKELIIQYLEDNINIVIKQVEYIERTKMGKFRRFESFSS